MARLNGRLAWAGLDMAGGKMDCSSAGASRELVQMESGIAVLNATRVEPPIRLCPSHPYVIEDLKTVRIVPRHSLGWRGEAFRITVVTCQTWGGNQ
jgi:hypothetical protein